MRTQTEERGTITLNKPVLINGVQVAEMSYDTDEISGELYAQAEAHKMKASGSKGGNLAGAVELDYSLHLYIGFAAVIAVNPSYTFEDMERIKGKSAEVFLSDRETQGQTAQTSNQRLLQNLPHQHVRARKEKSN